MSIATQIERIQNEVTTQEDLIAQITTALQNKAAGGSGGASLETCTVTVAPFGWDESNEKLCYVSATKIESGACGSYVQSAEVDSSLGTSYNSLGALTINNVLCGSTITLCVALYGYCDPYVETSGTSKLIKCDQLTEDSSGYPTLWHIVVQAPTVAGEQATVNFSYEP